jgi:hypothetical protein
VKKWTSISILSLMLAFSAVLWAQSFWGGKTMSTDEVKARWGSEKYDAKKFKDGPYETRAKMAYSIMMDKSLIQKPYDEIRQLFGPNEGFYFVDTYPAYIVQRGKNHSEETWQLVFRMDNSYKVRDIIMHKNCCEK